MWTPLQSSKRIQHALVENTANKTWQVELYPAGHHLEKMTSANTIVEALSNAEAFIKVNFPGYTL